MSFTVITGPPGIGKTSRLVQIASTAERRVFHNSDQIHVGSRFDCQDGKMIYHLSYNPSWPFRLTTHEFVGNYHDSVFLIDDARLFFHDFPREVDITGFLENHCAYGIDIYVVFQDLRFCDFPFLPEFFIQEVYFYNGFFSFFGLTPFSVCLCRRRSSGLIVLPVLLSVPLMSVPFRNDCVFVDSTVSGRILYET